MLDQLRKELNDLDETLIELLEKRFKVTEQVGAFKQRENMVVLQPEREAEIIERIAETLAESEYSTYIIEIYRSIFEQSRSQQSKYVK
ncbi:chorismate mutase [Fusibacter paucivorans]|uniref:Chorismate mutase n=1 Tax=Fusibacter paucivorans TaxID=76009 RepID=A0ABS5PLH9_9FIRM|nr:chorismate mutase [Fusibacter paucivorans]MBS7526015.1 chorismate mutase [Fusibacter paucivorans]